VVGFAAAHRFVLACHVEAFLGTDRAVAYRRLHGLTRAGLLSYRRIFHAAPGVFQVTNGGLALIDSPLSRPRVDLRTYRHDVGAAWLWLAARAGRFGPPARVWSERELRSHLPSEHAADLGAWAVTVDGVDRTGRPRVHHPDVLVLDAGGPGCALELELSVKSRRRLEQILLGYSACAGVREVVYVTDSEPVRRVLRTTIQAFGLDGLVSVQYLDATDHDRAWWLWPSIKGLHQGAR
jgi:hypothetical protein